VNKALLDTSGYTSFLSGDERVLETLANSDVVYMSIFVLGELFAGFKGGSRFNMNKSILEQFLQKTTVEVLKGNKTTAEIFGQLKDTLKKAGTPIPINDIWIAAHALETGSVLITLDTHFEKCPGVRLWDYFPSDV
jgi:tRNA(fMet)-specific endonuclease VapC